MLTNKMFVRRHRMHRPCRGARPSSPGDADVMREAKDRGEIEKLMWDYARALDTGNAEAYAAVYTVDGAFGETKVVKR